MSTEVTSTSNPETFSITLGEPFGANDAVNISARTRHGSGTFQVSRADFLAAVAKECGVIVIDRADLPEIKPGDSPDQLIYGDIGKSTYVGIGGRDVAAIRAQAYRVLALAEYLDAHPPVDEAQVEALAQVIRETFPGEVPRAPDRLMERARRLVAAGVRAPEAGGRRG